MAYLATYGGPRSERRFSETADVSLWSPLRQTAFLSLFVAAFASNIGTWIQNVAAAWLMTSLAPNALMVGLVQTLSGLPVFLLIIPAGALADLIDRRTSALRPRLDVCRRCLVGLANCRRCNDALGIAVTNLRTRHWCGPQRSSMAGDLAATGAARRTNCGDRSKRYSVQFGASDRACNRRCLNRRH